MNELITRTKEEIQAHLDFINNEIVNREGTPEQLAEETSILGSIADACYSALNDETFVPLSASAPTKTLSDKYFLYTCLWMQGKLFTAPNYVPLREKQFSTQQVLEDFGNSKYTAFEIA